MAKRRIRTDRARELNYGTPITRAPGSLRQMGTSLSWAMLGTFNGFLRNPNSTYLNEYERAYLTDETISVAIEFTVMSLLASLGEYEHPKKDRQAFVREMFTHMEGTPQSMIGELVTSALWAGFGVSESVLVQDGRHIALESVQNYHPGHVHVVVDKNGKLTFGKQPGLQGPLKTGIYQRNPFNGMATPLPRNRTCLVTHRRRHNNYYGESAIQPIFKNWLFKDAVFGMWAVALDRYGTPIPVAIVPRVTTGAPVEDPYAPGGVRSQTYAEQAIQVFQNLGAGGSLVFEEYSKDHPVKVNALTTGNNFGTSFLDAVRYCNQAIFRGMLIPKLLLEEGKAGSSKGLGTIHFNSFRMMLKSLNTMIVQPIVQQIIGPILYWNFGERDPGCFPTVPFDAASAEILAMNFDKLTMGGLVDMNMLNDLNQMRAVFGFSAVTQAQLNKRQYLAEAAAGMQAPAKPADNPKQETPVQLSLQSVNLPAGTLPEVVVVVVADDNGRILLTRRSATETHRPREWEVPGGHRDPGENVVTAAVREVIEETGLSAIPQPHARHYFPLREGGFGVMIGARLTGLAEVRLKRDEHDRFAWVWPEELEEFFPVPPDFVANVSSVWSQLMGEPLGDEELEDDGEADDDEDEL